ncbi:MAG: extracellular solute-binding protein [Clostridia bacterium]|nr:extracellular solute-binding protein [Clostridia bacterium]
MTSLKKVLSLMLSALMSFGIFTACGTNTDSLNEDQDEKIIYEDYGEEAFLIGTTDQDINPFGYKQDSFLADESIKRLVDIGERHNCTIDFEFLGTEDTYKNALVGNLATMDNAFDFIYGPSHLTRGFALAGGLVPLTDVSEIIDVYDFEKWGEFNVQEMMMVNGILYGLFPSSWMEKWPAFCYLLVTNNKIMKNFGAPDVRELVEKGEWSRDTLEQLIKDCSDKTLATPIYSMAACVKHMLRASILGNGCNMIIEDAEAKTVAGWDTPQAIEAMTWLQTLIKDNQENFYGNAINRPNNDDWGFTVPFVNNEAAMLFTSVSTILSTVIYEIEDFSLAPWPNGPSGTYGEWAGHYEGSSHTSIPVFTKDPLWAATLINEIFEPLDSYPSYNAILEHYRSKVFHDPRDADILLAVGKSAQFCYWTEGGDDMLNGMTTSFLTQAPAANIKANISKMSKVLEEHITPNYIALKDYIKNIKD